MIDQGKLNTDELMDIILEVQEKAGCWFSAEEVCEITQYTIRKAELNGKDESYVPILLENELKDFLMRKKINLFGRLNHVRNLQPDTMPSQVPKCS